MSQTLELVQRLAASGEVRISEHGYDELAADNISVQDILLGISSALLVEDMGNCFENDNTGGPCNRLQARKDFVVGLISGRGYERKA